jgi:hypothetical protein
MLAHRVAVADRAAAAADMPVVADMAAVAIGSRQLQHCEPVATRQFECNKST